MENVGKDIPDRRKNMCKGIEIKVNVAGGKIVGGLMNSEQKGWIEDCCQWWGWTSRLRSEINGHKCILRIYSLDNGETARLKEKNEVPREFGKQNITSIIGNGVKNIIGWKETGGREISYDMKYTEVIQGWDEEGLS